MMATTAIKVTINIILDVIYENKILQSSFPENEIPVPVSSRQTLNNKKRMGCS